MEALLLWQAVIARVREVMESVWGFVAQQRGKCRQTALAWHGLTELLCSPCLVEEAAGDAKQRESQSANLNGNSVPSNWCWCVPIYLKA